MSDIHFIYRPQRGVWQVIARSQQDGRLRRRGLLEAVAFATKPELVAAWLAKRAGDTNERI